MRRPLLSVALLYASGVLLASYLQVPIWLLFSVAGVLVLLTLAWGGARQVLLGLLIVSASWTDYAIRTSILSPHDLRGLFGTQASLVSLRGRLLETPTVRVYQPEDRPSWRTTARLEVSQVRRESHEWEPGYGRVMVLTRGALTNLHGGQDVEVNGVIDLPSVAAAEGLFDYRAYLFQQGIYYRVRAESEADWKVIHSAALPLGDRFREWAKKQLGRGLAKEDESLLLQWALTIGAKAALTEEVSEPFIRAATYHIFAVDVLRMAILFGIFFTLFRSIGVPREIGGALLVPLIWFYVALTGWPASAIRACVMLTVVISGWVFRRPSDLMNSLFAAALIILIWEPRQLFQAGFQLSFVVVFFILVLLRPIRRAWFRLWEPDALVPDGLRPRWRKWFGIPGGYLSDLMLTSFVAWLGSIPLVAYYFNVVTPVSTPANIIAVPFCALVLISNLASLLFASWCPFLTELLNHAGWFFMEVIRITSLWFASWPKAYFYSVAPGLFTTLVYYGLLLAVGSGWIFLSRARVLRVAACALALLTWFGHQCFEPGITRLTVLGLPGGYAVYCDPPRSQEDLLIDCGTTNAVQFIAKPFLRAQGVNRLEGLVL